MRFWLRSPLRNADKQDGGEGGGGAPAFDPVAFKMELLAETRKVVTEALKASAKKPPEKEPPPAAEDEPASDAPVKPDAAARAMQKKLEAMEKKLQDQEALNKQIQDGARAKERAAAVKAEIAKLGLVDGGSKAAEKLLDGELRWTEDGRLVAGDGETPVEEFAARYITEQHSYLLKPKDIGGAGASAGASGGKAVDINDIRPGMSPETLSNARQQIAALAQQSLKEQ